MNSLLIAILAGVLVGKVVYDFYPTDENQLDGYVIVYDRDGKEHPSFASLSDLSLKTTLFTSDESEANKLLTKVVENTPGARIKTATIRWKK